MICFMIGAIAGYLYFSWVTKREIRYVMAKFTTAVEVEYLMLLKRHGIKLNDNGKEFIAKVNSDISEDKTNKEE